MLTLADLAELSTEIAANKYIEAKTGVQSPETIMNLPKEYLTKAKNNASDRLITKSIRKMENGDDKQFVSYLNGVRTKGNGTFLGFLEHKIETAK